MQPCFDRLCFLCLIVLACRLHATAAEDSIDTRLDPGLGLTLKRPSGVRAIATNQGYMIPYQAKIPGQDVTFEMVPVPGGKFMMGSPADEQGRHRSEGPQIEVSVAPFWMGKYEVTWNEYDRFCDLHALFREFENRKTRQVTGANAADAVTAPTQVYDPVGRYPNVRKKEIPHHPAVSMTQYGAKQYTEWLSRLTTNFYRLPTEAEWEYACRAGSSAAYCFGENPKMLYRYAWYFDNSPNEGTHPVGRRFPNDWGIHDMHGNVAEWVLDQFAEDTYSRLKERIAADGPPFIPPMKRFPRTVRGGSWASDAKECRSSSRRGSNEHWQSEDPGYPPSPCWLADSVQTEIGFRIVRPLVAPAIDERKKYWDADTKSLTDGLRMAIEEGRSVHGMVDPNLPAAIRLLENR